MAEIGSAYVALVPSLQGFWSRASRDLSAGSAIAGQAAGRDWSSRFSSSARGVDVRPGMAAAASQAAAGGREAGDRFGSGMAESVRRHMASVGAIVAGAAATAIAATATIGVKSAANLQQTRIAFETMLGSGQKAQKFLVDLQKFARDTPFEMPDLQRSAQSLISIGIEADKVIPIMTSLGNITSGMGTGSEGIRRATIAIQQMNAAQRITAEDLNQLRDAGVPVFELLTAATGKSTAEIAKMASAGKLGKKELDQLMAALESGQGLERFNGMMEKQSQTLAGRWAALKDTFAMGAAGIMEPFIPVMTTALEKATSLIQAWVPRVQAWSEEAVAKFPAVAARVSEVFNGIKAGDFGPLQETFSNLWDVLAPTIAAIRDADFSPLVDGFRQLGPLAVQAMSVLGPVFSAAVSAANTVLGFMADHIDTLVALVPVLLAGYVAWRAAMIANAVAGRESALGVMLNVTAAGMELAAAVLSLGVRRQHTAAIVAQTAALSLATNVQIAHTAADGTSTSITIANTASITANNTAQNQGLAARLRSAAATVWQTAVTSAQAAATWVATAAQRALNFAMTMNPIAKVVAVVALLAGGLFLLYRNNETVRKAIDRLWGSLKAFASDVWEQRLRPAFEAIRGFITDELVPAFQSFWSDSLQPILSGIGALFAAVWSGVLQPVFAALWAGIQGLGQILSATWTGILQPVFATLGAFVMWTWTYLVKPALDGIWWTVQNVLAPVLMWLWTNVVSPVFGWIGEKVALVWNLIIKPALTALWAYVQQTLIPTLENFWPIVRSVWDQVGAKINTTWIFIRGIFELLKGGLNSVRDYFDRITGEIRILWDQMKANVAKPINFVINEVLNKGLIAGWNLVADGIGQKDKKWAPINPIPGYDRGGWTGPGGKYDPAGIVHADEFVIRKESQRDISREAPGLLDALNRYGAAALGRLAPGFSGGGLVPGYAGGGLAKPWPTYVAALVKKMFGVRDIGGYGQRANASDHPSGNALDIMVPVRSELGDRIAAWGLANFNPLMLKYIIWKQAISKGGGWKGMADRGSVTANHYDHNHWSFIHDTWGRPAELGPVLSPDEVASLVASGGAGNPMEAILMSAIRPLLDGAKLAAGSIPVTYGDSSWTRMASGFGLNRIDAVEKFIAEKISSMFGVVGSYGPGDSEPGAVGGVKGVVQSVASQYGWGGGAQWAALDWLIQRESSWNPNAKNPSSTAYGLFQFLQCVPMDTLILTQDGWKTHSEVVIGDLTPGYNEKTGATEWTPIRAIVRKTQQPLVRLSNSRWEARVTPGHRWVTLQQQHEKVGSEDYSVCPECGAAGGKRGPFTSSRSLRTHRGRTHGVPSRVSTRTAPLLGMTETQDLNTTHQVILTAKASTDNVLPITDAEAFLLGYLDGDGVISPKAVTLYQAKPRNVEEIRVLLTGMGIPFSEYVRTRGDNLPEHSFYFPQEVARDLFARANRPLTKKQGVQQFILQASDSQRRAWLDGMIEAEGTAVEYGAGSAMRIPQNDGEVADAIMLATYLEGFRPSRRRRTGRDGFGMITMARPTVHVAALTTEDAGVEDVWCVQTDLGTWTMRQGEHIMLTGNSTWAGTGFSKSADPRQQAAAGMKYISQRYGTPTSAKAFWEKNHWYADGGLVKPSLYDTGGILPPGLTLAMNATGKPETIRTFEQERTIQQQLAGGGGATYVTNVHGGGDPQRAAAEVEQVMRRNEIRRRARERVLAHA